VFIANRIRSNNETDKSRDQSILTNNGIGPVARGEKVYRCVILSNPRKEWCL
jgi:hypothetical protein